MDGNYAREREELSWYFAGLGPTVGLRAGSLEPGGGQVYDDKRADEAHGRRQTPQHRAELARLRLVEAALARVPHVKGPLALAFTPVGAGRVSYRLLTAFMFEGLSLVGLAITSGVTARLWRARLASMGLDTEAEPTSYEAIQFLEHEVAQLKQGNRITSASPGLMNVYDDCVADFSRDLPIYAGARTVVRLEEQRRRAAERQAYVDSVIAAAAE